MYRCKGHESTSIKQAWDEGTVRIMVGTNSEGDFVEMIALS